MRLSEAQINKLSDEDEEVDDESIYTYLKAMNTLGHASLVRSDKVNQSTLDLVQGLLLDCIESIKMSEGQLEKFKAVGIVLLGQQALKNREFAEQVVPILGRLILQTDSKSGTPESSGRSVIRINAVKTLADLCVRYTALVEPFLPDMCVTMKDTDPMVRETIVVIFVQLLLEEFIKVKGAFFYHILTMLSDSDETIRELTVYLIKERLLAKNKSLVSQSFIKGIFHYNNCKLKHKFHERKIREKERNVLLLPGKKNESRRRIIYDFMLEHLDPPSKLKILMKLNAEIFEGACEKFIDVKQIEGACVVKDVIYIVSNDRMQASSTSFQDDDMHEDVAAAVENQINQAVNVIAEGMKKFKFQIMTQTLMKLRQFLIQNKSPGLLVDVSKLLSKLLSEFNKDQISEILDEYPDLRRDIDRDISMSNDMTDDSDSDSSEEQSSGKKALEITDVSNAEEQLSDDVAKKVSQETVATEPLKTPKATPRKICEVSLTGMPRMVLRRFSALTYPGVQAWKSPSHSTIATISELEPSNKSTLDETNMCVDDLSDSESIQKPNKIARLAESVADVTIS
ncbi:condensin-2 complex subunit D3-like [Copidosoma floridanum]|uniref:condensin-2 complex subunit D3-like n=1 Tax=Copidosoma floridanum TaxID=29053 RepID=UPI0006C9ADEE|nr:condensin-2 complex subunit D3-like [Copidosoma floridanum]